MNTDEAVVAFLYLVAKGAFYLLVTWALLKYVGCLS